MLCVEFAIPGIANRRQPRTETCSRPSVERWGGSRFLALAPGQVLANESTTGGALMSRLLFQNAHVVHTDVVRTASVLIEDGKILDVDAGEHAAAEHVLDCRGLHLMPGVIDDQVHFREPGLTHKEDLETASRACAAGGVTSFLEMPNTKPPAITVEAVRAKSKSRRKSRESTTAFTSARRPTTSPS